MIMGSVATGRAWTAGIGQAPLDWSARIGVP
jgi:hypothetical protein